MLCCGGRRYKELANDDAAARLACVVGALEAVYCSCRLDRRMLMSGARYKELVG